MPDVVSVIAHCLLTTMLAGGFGARLYTVQVTP